MRTSELIYLKKNVSIHFSLLQREGEVLLKIIMHRYRLNSYQYFIQKWFLLGCTHHKEFNDFYQVEIYGQPCSYRQFLTILFIVSFIKYDLFQNGCFTSLIYFTKIQISRFLRSINFLRFFNLILNAQICEKYFPLI